VHQLQQIDISTLLQQFSKHNLKEIIMQNIERNFGNQSVSEETLKIATENAIKMLELTTLTEIAIAARDAELAEALRIEIFNAQQGV
jgi:hypothetical protein